MRQSEIRKLVKAFQTPKRWSQDAEARTERGEPCHCTDLTAWSFSLDGFFFKMMGPWAMPYMVSFVVDLGIARGSQLRTKADPPGAALTALMDFNDSTSFRELRRRLLRLEAN
jgi:hypothetical protein